jgi:monolysocardiolipin acyltransferase
LGHTIPLNREGSIDQLPFQYFYSKLDSGSWCHIFPEGGIRQRWRYVEDREPVLGKFKIGVGKLIAHCSVCPIVVPMYHKGMDAVSPEIPLERGGHDYILIVVSE